MSQFDTLLQKAADGGLIQIVFHVDIEDRPQWVCESRTSGMDGVDFMFVGEGRTKTGALRKMLRAYEETLKVVVTE